LIRRIPVIAGPIAGGILIDRMGIVRGVRTGAAVSIVLALFCRPPFDSTCSAER